MTIRKFGLLLAMAASLCLSLCTTSLAGSITFATNAIDLTDGVGSAGGAGGNFGLPNGITDTIGGVTLTVNAFGSEFQTTGNNPEPIGVNGNAQGDADDDPNGIGVRGNGGWALNRGGVMTAESLEISFDQDVLLCSIDLNGVRGFANNANDRPIISFDSYSFSVRDLSTVQPENGMMAPAGTTYTGGSATSVDLDVVNFTTAVLLPAGSVISFEVPSIGSGSVSLRNIVVSPVPEPALPLGLIAGLALAMLRRRS